MRTFDSLYRSTVGFDRLFDMLDSANRPDWPPYNIEKKGENDYRIVMAIAGFTPDEIELNQNGPELIVIGQKAADAEARQFLHQGMALRNFRQAFKLADHMKVTGASLESGLLLIDIVREIPEQLKPRRIEIANGTAPVASEQITQDIGQARKAA